jgi:hypothetical protein
MERSFIAVICDLIHPTLRGIFFCLTRNKESLCPRMVFSQTQEIKNICLKRRFQFVERKKLKIENPYPFARKELAYFYAPLHCTPLRFKKANTFPPALIFAEEQKCIINHFVLGFCGRNGSD